MRRGRFSARQLVGGIRRASVPFASTRRPRRRLPRVPWGARAPLLIFAVVYVLTCLLGAVCMLAGFSDFNRLFTYFSGTRVAHLSNSQAVVDVILLFAAPAALCVGYELGLKLRMHRRLAAWAVDQGRTAAPLLQTPPWFPPLVFLGTVVVASVSIAHSGSVSHVSSWLNYRAWIAAREQTFRHISFFEFVNIYLLLPIAAAWVAVTYRSRGSKAMFLRWAPLGVTLAIDLLLFQKKTAIVSLLIVMFAWLVASARERRRYVTYAALATGAAVTAVYLATVVAPVYSRTAHASLCTAARIDCHGATAALPGVVVYTILSPLTRSSAPALYYPIIFPHHHSFYPLSSLFALDILGIGTFPNDNQVVWHFLNPTLPGTTSVPFQFTLYSQGGLSVAIVGSLVVGVILALAWRFVRSDILPRDWSALAGSMVLLLALYLAIDSLRNSTLVSYGMVWGLVFVALVAITVRFGNGGAREPRYMAPNRSLRLPIRVSTRHAEAASVGYGPGEPPSGHDE